MKRLIRRYFKHVPLNMGLPTYDIMEIIHDKVNYINNLMLRMQCVPWVVFIYRFHCISTTIVCPLGGLYIQVPLYINYYNVSLRWPLYTGSTLHQLLQCVLWVVFIYRFHCTSTTIMCPLGGLYIQVPLYINYYSVSFGWSLYTGSTVYRLL